MVVVVLALAGVAMSLGAGQEIAAAFGWIAAGLTIALQRAVTAAAGYLIIKVGRTDNWVELTPRFLIRAREARSIKDQMSRDIIDALDEAKIGIASGTYAIVEVPTLTVRQARS